MIALNLDCEMLMGPCNHVPLTFVYVWDLQTPKCSPVKSRTFVHEQSGYWVSETTSTRKTSYSAVKASNASLPGIILRRVSMSLFSAISFE